MPPAGVLSALKSRLPAIRGRAPGSRLARYSLRRAQEAASTTVPKFVPGGCGSHPERGPRQWQRCRHRQILLIQLWGLGLSALACTGAPPPYHPRRGLRICWVTGTPAPPAPPAPGEHAGPNPAVVRGRSPCTSEGREAQLPIQDQIRFGALARAVDPDASCHHSRDNPFAL